MRLLSQVVSLFFSLSFPIKPERLRKTIFHRLYQVIFMAQIKIITQPLNTISMSPRRHTSLFNKGSVPADKIGRDPTALLGASGCKHPASPAMLAGQRRD